jgi:hypothetical protein
VWPERLYLVSQRLQTPAEHRKAELGLEIQAEKTGDSNLIM